MVSPDECLWGADFFDTYLHHARKKSYKNDKLHIAAALSLVGQSLRDVWIRADQTTTDCRIHPFIIQSSGTGKDSAFGMANDVADAAGIDFHKHGSDSTAGIVGTVKRNGDVQKGDLAGDGFVAWKEAQLLLKASNQQHSSDIIEVINEALDPTGQVNKSLSGGTLEFNSRSSLFCTTYVPEENGQVELIQKGFLPRTLFLYRALSSDFYDDVNQRRDEGLPRPGDSNEEYIGTYDEDIQKLGNTLKYIENQVYQHGEVMHKDESHYASGRNQIRYFRVDEGVSLDPTPIIEDVLSDYSYSVRKRFKPFRTRFFDNVYRMAAAFAAVDRGEEKDYYVSRIIRKKHAKRAKDVVRWSIQSVAEFIKDFRDVRGNEKLRSVYTTTKTLAMENGGEVTIKEIMREEFDHKSNIKDALTTLEEMDLVKSNGTALNVADEEDKVILPESEMRDIGEV